MEKKNSAAKEIDSLMGYRNALRGDDQKIFDKLVEYAKGHVKACAQADFNLFDSMLLAMVLEQQKIIDKLAVSGLETRNPEPEKRHHRPQDIDLHSVFNRIEVKGAPPWALC